LATTEELSAVQQSSMVDKDGQNIIID